MNAENIMKLVGFLENMPDRTKFHMPEWQQQRECGSVACIGGWTEVLFSEKGEWLGLENLQKRFEDAIESFLELEEPNSTMAQRVLGLTSAEREYLFYTSCSKQNLCSIDREMAIDTLKRFAETGHLRWPADDKSIQDRIAAGEFPEYTEDL